jgi:hypothetical protein
VSLIFGILPVLPLYLAAAWWWVWPTAPLFVGGAFLASAWLSTELANAVEIPPDALLGAGVSPTVALGKGVELANDAPSLEAAAWVLESARAARDDRRMTAIARVPSVSGEVVVWTRHPFEFAWVPTSTAAGISCQLAVYHLWSTEHFIRSLLWVVEGVAHRVPKDLLVGLVEIGAVRGPAMLVAGVGVLAFLGAPILLAWWAHLRCEKRLAAGTFLRIEGRLAQLMQAGILHRFCLEDVVEMTPTWRSLRLELRDGRCLVLPADQAQELTSTLRELGAMASGPTHAAVHQLASLRRLREA